MCLVPGGAIMQCHADVDDAAALGCFQGWECSLAHGEGSQGVDIQHCMHMGLYRTWQELQVRLMRLHKVQKW